MADKPHKAQIKRRSKGYRKFLRKQKAAERKILAIRS